MTFTIRPDRPFIRSTYRSNRYLLVELTAPTSRRAPSREPLNTAFVLDRSGSMSGRKIALARQAIDAAIGALDGSDRFAVVAYDDRVEIVAPSAPASGPNRNAASRALAAIDARGSTNLFEGWMRGCAEVAQHQGEPGLARVLLMSDGLANIGVTDREELVRHAGELWRRGVATWTFGFGADFDEDLMERMAHAGGGQSFYVEHPEQIRDHVTNAVGEALDVVARDVVLHVEAPEGVIVEPLSLFRHHKVAGATIVELGDLVSDQELRLVLKVNLPFGRDGDLVGIRVTLRDRDGIFISEEAGARWTYADGVTNDRQPRDRDVDREVARLYAARARKEAVQANRAGRYADADQAMRGVARRIRGYAGSDPEMNALIAELEQEQLQVRHAMAAPMQKEMHYRSSYVERGRDPMGKARKNI
ncbi:MAG: VWA domain-containing protein [Chloroflexota bacterium]